MSFDSLLTSVRSALAAEGRIAYRILKRRFELSDDDIEDIKADLIDAKQLARDENGRVLVWLGEAQAVEDTTRPDQPELPQNADRRLITVMFCDIVGSTELSGRFDAEELREIIRDYQTICAEVIVAAEGHVAQYLGDGLLVYFGYPAALEDEAGRCVQAALDILKQLKAASHLEQRLGAPLRVRIGIHTGSVVIGEMGGANRHERLALGETPNIAARVQGAARPDEILITAATQRLVDGLYDCELHGPHTLKGVAEPVKLYTVKGESAQLNRFEVALSTGSFSPFVGREQELGLLGRHWEQARNGNAQVVLLTGEAGMGKSRLVQEFKEHLGDDVRHITLRCSPNHQSSAYFPLIQLFLRAFAIDSDDNDELGVAKLETALKDHAFVTEETAPLMAGLLGFEHPQAERIATLSTEARRSRLFEAIIAWFEAQSDAAPVYLIFDDVHWMDAATHEWLQLYLDHVGSSRVLTMLVYRADYSPPWTHRSYFAQLSIGRLPNSDVRQMINHICASVRLAESIYTHICDKADGIPLFVEELAKSVLESGSADRLSIPSTLQDSLEARIDHCPHGKRIAQVGAVIGREFGQELLTYLFSDRELLSRGLEELLDAELIYRSGTRADPSYIFKHALIRDTAYESLLVRQRRQTHTQIAAALEEYFEEAVEREPELIAYHYAEGDVSERAILHLYAASERAISNSANAIAQEHLQQGLKIAARLPDNVERAAFELKLLLLLGPLVSAARGNASREVGGLYKRALQLCERAADRDARFPAYFGLRAFHLANSDLKAAHEIGLALFRAATGSGRADYLLEANVALVSSYFFLGDLDAVERHVTAALKVYDREQHSQHALIYGTEPGSSCLVWQAQCSWMQGRHDRCREQLMTALAHAESLNHDVSQAFAYVNAAMVFDWLGEYETAESRADLALDIATTQNIAFAQAWSLIQRGHARIRRGQLASGTQDIEQGLKLLDAPGQTQSTRSQLMYSWFVALTADAYGCSGEPERGLALIPEALSLAEKTGARYAEPELYRIRGELLLKSNLLRESERSLQHAFELAERRQASSFALRTAISLVELEASPPNYARLESILAKFDDSTQSHDLRLARSLTSPRQS